MRVRRAGKGACSRRAFPFFPLISGFVCSTYTGLASAVLRGAEDNPRWMPFSCKIQWPALIKGTVLE